LFWAFVLLGVEHVRVSTEIVEIADPLGDNHSLLWLFLFHLLQSLLHHHLLLFLG
jgi:hypothetical protein